MTNGLIGKNVAHVKAAEVRDNRACQPPMTTTGVITTLNSAARSQSEGREGGIKLDSGIRLDVDDFLYFTAVSSFLSSDRERRGRSSPMT